MSALPTFVHVRGYAPYQWPAYGITFIVIVLNIVWARRALTRARAEAQRRMADWDEPALGGEEV